MESISCYDTGCEAQGILPPRLLLAEHTNDLCQSFDVCTEGDLGGLRQGVMTPHKLHNSSASKRAYVLHFLSTIPIMYSLR